MAGLLYQQGQGPGTPKRKLTPAEEAAQRQIELWRTSQWSMSPTPPPIGPPPMLARPGGPTMTPQPRVATPEQEAARIIANAGPEPVASPSGPKPPFIMPPASAPPLPTRPGGPGMGIELSNAIMRSRAPERPSIWQRIGKGLTHFSDNLVGVPSGGLLSDAERHDARRAGLMGLGAAIASAPGESSTAGAIARALPKGREAALATVPERDALYERVRQAGFRVAREGIGRKYQGAENTGSPKVLRQMVQDYSSLALAGDNESTKIVGALSNILASGQTRAPFAGATDMYTLDEEGNAKALNTGVKPPPGSKGQFFVDDAGNVSFAFPPAAQGAGAPGVGGVPVAGVRGASQLGPDGQPIMTGAASGLAPGTGMDIPGVRGKTKAAPKQNPVEQKALLSVVNLLNGAERMDELEREDPTAGVNPALYGMARASGESKIAEFDPTGFIKGGSEWLGQRQLTPNQKKWQEASDLYLHNSVTLLPGYRGSIPMLAKVEQTYRARPGQTEADVLKEFRETRNRVARDAARVFGGNLERVIDPTDGRFYWRVRADAIPGASATAPSPVRFDNRNVPTNLPPGFRKPREFEDNIY